MMTVAAKMKCSTLHVFLYKNKLYRLMAFERFDSYAENNCNVYVVVIHPRTGPARFVFLRMYTFESATVEPWKQYKMRN